MSLDFGFEAVHVDSTVVSISVLVLVFPLDMVCGLLMLPLWLDAFFQLYKASHIWGEMFRLSGACRRRSEAAVALVGRHLLDAYHGLGFTDQRNLRYIHVIHVKEDKFFVGICIFIESGLFRILFVTFLFLIQSLPNVQITTFPSYHTKIIIFPTGTLNEIHSGHSGTTQFEDLNDH